MKNVGGLFFSRSIETLCEQATITCAVFDGTERVNVMNRENYQEDIVTNIGNDNRKLIICDNRILTIPEHS